MKAIIFALAHEFFWCMSAWGTENYYYPMIALFLYMYGSGFYNAIMFTLYYLEQKVSD